VRFWYKNNQEEGDAGGGKKGRREEMKLEVEEWVRRLMLHVPERGVQGVRFYGVYKGSAPRGA
ncbi:MAG: transposase, partial [Nitrospira sp.]|nr:transposase [Nitrospira sp.]